MPTAAEWRDLQITLKAERQPEVDLYERYYDGHHRLQFATAKFKEAFGELFQAFADNWCALVVDGAVERLNIQGFRFGEDEADEEAWAIWQANGLDARSIQGHEEAVKLGIAYLLVGPPQEDGGEPVITVEHPSQCITVADPADRRIQLAGLKEYRELDGTHVAVVYEPDRITTFRRRTAGEALEGMGLYVPQDAGGDWDIGSPEDNPTGVVPLIPLENNPSLLKGGVSDLKPAISLNDAANKFFTDMLHASEYTSFPQRVLTGVELPRDPITGDVASDAQVRAAASRLWAFEDPQSKVHDLGIGPLTNYVEGIDLAVQHMAAQTRTPPHYLLAKMANLSGDALKAAETGLVARCRRKQIDMSDSWETAMRLAFAWRAIARQGWVGADLDYERSTMDDAETIWVNPESRNPGTVGDELVKKQAVGVPQVILWEEAGYTPQQIKRMKQLRIEEDEYKAQLAARQGEVSTPGGEETASSTVAVKEVGDVIELAGLPGPPEPEEAAQNGAGKEDTDGAQ